MITQHSGEGKANQYRCAGFQLDHGTDLAIWYDGMPLNMPTHGHGQGYADANFLIPELVSTRSLRIRGHISPMKATSPPPARCILISSTSLPNGGLFSATQAVTTMAACLALTSNKLEGGNLLSAVELGYLQWSLDHCATRCTRSTASCAGRRAPGKRLLDHRHGLRQRLACIEPDPRARRDRKG